MSEVYLKSYRVVKNVTYSIHAETPECALSHAEDLDDYDGKVLYEVFEESLVKVSYKSNYPNEENKNSAETV